MRFKATDRAAFEEAFAIAYSEGIGQSKFNDAVGYLATRREHTAQAFASWALDRGWPDAHILAAIDLGQRNKLFSGD
jgi:hypothetical protein